MNHDEDVVDARMIGEGGDASGHHWHPADWQILLGALANSGCPRSSSCRNNERRNGHERTLAIEGKTRPNNGLKRLS
jgi:hypothetical protein